MLNLSVYNDIFAKLCTIMTCFINFSLKNKIALAFIISENTKKRAMLNSRALLYAITKTVTIHHHRQKVSHLSFSWHDYFCRQATVKIQKNPVCFFRSFLVHLVK